MDTLETVVITLQGNRRNKKDLRRGRKEKHEKKFEKKCRKAPFRYCIFKVYRV